MMSQPLPPIYRDCRRLLVHTEAVVQRFSRYHKYTVGTDLRENRGQTTVFLVFLLFSQTVPELGFDPNSAVYRRPPSATPTNHTQKLI